MADKEVRVRVCFLLIGDVNTKEQTFKAEVLIEARWSGAPGEEFDPQLVVTNLEESKNEKKWLTKKVYSDYGDGRKREHNTLSWRFKGCFYENMELKNFPRDIQDLSVRVSSELEASEIQLMVDDVRLGTLDGSRFRDGEEWTLFNHVETQHVPEDDQRGKGWASRVEKGYTAGRVIAMCRVARRSRFFMVNNVMLMFALVILSLTCFAFDPGWNTSRISSSMTLLLVAVAFKLSVAGTLPVISYLTYLDAYILGAMVYLCMMTILFACISPFKEDIDTARKIDYGCMVFLVLFIVVFHIIYGIIFFKNTNRRYKEMVQKDREYAQKLEHLLEKEKQHAQQQQNRPASRQGSVRSGSSIPSQSHARVGSPSSYNGGRGGGVDYPASVGPEDIEIQNRRPTYREEEV